MEVGGVRGGGYMSVLCITTRRKRLRVSDEIDQHGLAIKQVIVSLCLLLDCLLHKTLQ